MDFSLTSASPPSSAFNSQSAASQSADDTSLNEVSLDKLSLHELSLDELVNRLCQRILARMSKRPAIQTSYRFQFHSAGFRFTDALKQSEYLRELGVSHVYSSPLLRSQGGSMHGYDVIDPTALNEELGSEEEFTQLVHRLRELRLGHILDIVPNHMSVANDQNRWWMDVLKHGPSSRYAHFFDIDWQPPRSRMHGRVLLPILPAASGKVLESGALQVRFQNGSFTLDCNSTHLPLDPKSWVELLSPGVTAIKPIEGSVDDELAPEGAILELQSIIAAIKHLPDRELASPPAIEERLRETQVIEQRLSRLARKSSLAAEHVALNLQAINGIVGQPASFDRLDKLLEKQAYRLVNWRASSDEINYRRFFDVSTLAALSIENFEVFETTHRLLLEMAAQGLVDAFRVDHVDGLFDPTQYLWRLQWGYLRETARFEYAQLTEKAARSAHSGPAHSGQAHNEQENKLEWRDIEPRLLDRLHMLLGGVSPKSVLTDDLPSASLTPPLSTNPLSSMPSSRDPRESSITTAPGDRPNFAPALATTENATTSDIETQETTGDDSLHENNAPLADGLTGWPLNVYVEKILGVEEPLPRNWPILGTTGYEFLNELNGLFIHQSGFQSICKAYARFVGDQPPFEDVVYECKRIILSGPMRSEVTLLANRLERIANRSRYWRDYTLNDLEFALQEIIACHSVYRTYIRRNFVSERDRQVLLRAVATAKRRNPASETDTFDFVRDLLLSEPLELGEDAWREREYLVGRFQQVTSPVQAKGVEDTAFYRYIPLVSIDEVGGEPSKALKSIEEFHQQNLRREQNWPRSLLSTTTHDTKRSEDVRARINVLSEIPAQWQKRLQRWHRLNKKHVRQVDGHDAPCRNDQWLIYQTLVGMWPVARPDHQSRHGLIERLVQYMEKATHEAKLHTSWIRPNAAYDQAVKEFIDAILSEEGSKFDVDLHEFIDGILDAGLMNAASQVLLKLTSPGVPDIYQGQELWDFSLVDPDNRRPVDYDLRRHLLHEIRQAVASPEERLQFARYLARNPRDNRLKMFVTLEALAFRNHLGLGQGIHRYVPLEVFGPGAEHWIAFAWHRPRRDRDADERDGAQADACEGIVVAPRMIQSLINHSTASVEEVSHGAGVVNGYDWSRTYVQLAATPTFASHSSNEAGGPNQKERDFKNAFTHLPVQLDPLNRLALTTLVSDFPFVLLY